MVFHFFSEIHDIKALMKAGVVIRARGAPTLRGNTIRDGAGKGVDVFDGTLELGLLVGRKTQGGRGTTRAEDT